MDTLDDLTARLEAARSNTLARIAEDLDQAVASDCDPLEFVVRATANQAVLAVLDDLLRRP